GRGDEVDQGGGDLPQGEDGVDASGVDGGPGHAEALRSGSVLGDDGPSQALEDLDAGGAVDAGPAEDDGDGAGPGGGGDRREQGSGRGARVVDRASGGQGQHAAGPDQQVVAGRADEYGAGAEPVAVAGLADREGAVLAEDLGQQAGPAGVEVLDHHHGGG